MSGIQTNKPKMTEVEIYGVESIPAKDRTSTPMDLFRIAFGGANSFATVLLGAFPIFFGLSLKQGLLATLLGVVLGSAILAPMAVFGPINGTNNAVSSGAHFGVVGRVLGSYLSLLTAIAFYLFLLCAFMDINSCCGLIKSQSQVLQ